MPEHYPDKKPCRLEIYSAQGEENLLIFSQSDRTIGLENGETTQLHVYEAELLDYLVARPNWPHKLFDIKRNVTAFDDKYAPNPLEVVKGTVETAPFLAGHLLAIVQGTTQFFSFLDRAEDSEEFQRNIDEVLDRDSDIYGPSRVASRHRKIKAIVAFALAGTAAASGVVGYRHHNKKR